MSGERLFYMQGSDRSSRAVEGCAVVLVRYREPEPGLIRCEVHTFVKVKSVFKRFLASMYLPLVSSTVNRRFGNVPSIPVVGYDSIRGRIETAWKKGGGKLTLNVTIPANITATVLVPAKSADAITENPESIRGWRNRPA